MRQTVALMVLLLGVSAVQLEELQEEEGTPRSDGEPELVGAAGVPKKAPVSGISSFADAGKEVDDHVEVAQEMLADSVHDYATQAREAAEPYTSAAKAAAWDAHDSVAPHVHHFADVAEEYAKAAEDEAYRKTMAAYDVAKLHAAQASEYAQPYTAQASEYAQPYVAQASEYAAPYAAQASDMYNSAANHAGAAVESAQSADLDTTWASQSRARVGAGEVVINDISDGFPGDQIDAMVKNNNCFMIKMVEDHEGNSNCPFCVQASNLLFGDYQINSKLQCKVWYMDRNKAVENDKFVSEAQAWALSRWGSDKFTVPQIWIGTPDMDMTAKHILGGNGGLQEMEQEGTLKPRLVAAGLING